MLLFYKKCHFCDLLATAKVQNCCHGYLEDASDDGLLVRVRAPVSDGRGAAGVADQLQQVVNLQHGRLGD